MTIRDEQCGEKRRFPTLQSARRALKLMRRANGLRPYLCPHCHGFHVGNTLMTKPRDSNRKAPAVIWRYNRNEDYDQ